ADSGYVKLPAGEPSALITAGSTGLSAPTDARAIAAATSAAVATTGGTKSTITASTPWSASTIGSATSYVPAVAEPSRSTGFALLASAGVTRDSAATVSGASGGSDRPAASHASAQRIPS